MVTKQRCRRRDWRFTGGIFFRLSDPGQRRGNRAVSEYAVILPEST
jgi:hypothetical protein